MFATNEALRDALATDAREIVSLGTFAQDQSMWCAVGGGRRRPAILVTAGAHADETSGPIAAAGLLSRLRTEHEVYVVPNRDPLGWRGFARALATAAGGSAVPATYEEAAAILRGGNVLFEDGSFLAALVGDLAFAALRPTGDSFGSEKAIAVLAAALRRAPGLLSRLAGRRVLIPANAPGCDGRGLLDRAYTITVCPDGFIGSDNRFFGHAAAPAEVTAVAKLVDEVRPGLAIDLHEGWDDGYYLFVSGVRTSDGEATMEVERRVESAMTAALRAEGARASSLSELVPNMPEEHLRRFTPLGAGRLAWRWDPVESSPWGVAFLPYARRWGMAVQTEIGRWTALADRVRYQTAAVIAAVRAYESAMIQSRDG